MTARLLWSVLGTLLLTTGCAFHRENVARLSKGQDRYYTALAGTLKTDRDEFKEGLTAQLEVSRVRERQMLQWGRDLSKMNVLLQAGTETTGGEKSLLLEAAATDLASVNQVIALDTIDQARLNAIINLYDAVISAVGALQTNSTAITKYLTSSKSQFALQSLDAAALATSISDLQDLRDQLNGAQARTAAAKAANAENIDKTIEKTRETLLQGFKALHNGNK